MAKLSKKNIREFIENLKLKKINEVKSNFRREYAILREKIICCDEEVLKDHDDFAEFSKKLDYFKYKYDIRIYLNTSISDIGDLFAYKVADGKDELQNLSAKFGSKKHSISKEFERLKEIANTLTPLKAYELFKELGLEVKPLDDILSLNTPARLDDFKHNFNMELLK